MTIIGVKRKLQKSKIGQLIIKIYHYCVAIPIAKMYLLKYHLMKNMFKDMDFYSIDETFSMLINDNYSLCRFGDGEIAWIYRDSKGYFGQENSEELSLQLKKVILSNEKQVLIGIPNFFENVEHYDKKHKEMRDIHLAKYGKRWMPLINQNKKYVDALITRIYYGHKDTNYEYMFKMWKKVWKERVIIIIEGSETRFGIGNDLLNNAKSVTRIIAPAENAYVSYNSILSIAIQQSTDALYLVALGPTATVLAFDLALCGRQAIDIGHLDIEYEWYLRGALKKEPVIGKYVNEMGGSSDYEFSGDLLRVYNSQIIARCDV